MLPLLVRILQVLQYCFHWDTIGYRKKRRNVQNTDHEMFKLADTSGSYGDVSQKGTLGLRNRFVQRFTRKETRFNDTENILGVSKGKSRKKIKKDNIYDIDEVDSKFEGDQEI